jgi:iron(II)-dependent oxidoreductase
MRRLLVAVLLLTGWVRGQDVVNHPDGEQIPGPACAETSVGAKGCSEADLKAYHADIEHWRNEERIRAGLSSGEYRVKALQWAEKSYVQPQMMVHDRYFYDASAGGYTVGRYLDDVGARYGGIDSVLIWPTYPNIGVDDRNQFDLFHDMPNGLAGIKGMVDAFHARGVRVLFPVMLWDQGTRDVGETDYDALAEELAAVGADGVNGDTLQGMPRVFVEAANRVGHPLALEPEVGMGSDEMVGYNVMSWGYWHGSAVPTLSRYKWLETRHMVNISNRWGKDHTNDLQEAFFNGVGFESWENVWGIWNGITPRDAEALRRVATIERGVADFLVSKDWEPHVEVKVVGVAASRWPLGDETVWTLVNRNGYAIHGDCLPVAYAEGMKFYDLWHGVELTPKIEGGRAVLKLAMEANGFGAVLATRSLSEEQRKMLEAMLGLAAKPLAEYSHAWQVLPQRMVEIAAAPAKAASESGMVRLPAAAFRFRVSGTEIEGGNDDGVDVEYPWESSPRRFHDSVVKIGALWMDKYPVTNAEFKAFLDATHYAPADAHNFLRNWKGGTYPEGWAKKPVTWVSIEDARAYAKWAGKRLPHEWEWQYGAQGSDGRPYPWGDALSAAAMPLVDTGRTMQPAADVDAHPAGASPFGVMDMVGNVWQWTDEFVDEHTRAAVVRGGSHYRPQGSRWYFPQAYRNDLHSKYLLMAPSLDRSGAIGFRCVKDAVE